MASQDLQILLLVTMISIAINIWLYRVNVKLTHDKKILHALNARHQEYQEGWFR
jgi:divalent metal cation (Fe/Co/Zn/Cd) transporter